MEVIRKWFQSWIDCEKWSESFDLHYHHILVTTVMTLLWALAFFMLLYSILHGDSAFAAGNSVSLPGEDMSSSLQAAGILLKTLDTGIFKWGARLFAGLCIMSSAWALKEQRFGIAIICVIGAILFGTAPKWVSNIFDMGGNGGIFTGSANHVSSPASPMLCESYSNLIRAKSHA